MDTHESTYLASHPDEPMLLCNKCGNLVEFVMDQDHDRYPYWCQGCERRLSSSNVRLDPERKQLTIGVD